MFTYMFNRNIIKKERLGYGYYYKFIKIFCRKLLQICQHCIKKGCALVRGISRKCESVNFQILIGVCAEAHMGYKIDNKIF